MIAIKLPAPTWSLTVRDAIIEVSLPQQRASNSVQAPDVFLLSLVPVFRCAIFPKLLALVPDRPSQHMQEQENVGDLMMILIKQ